MDLTWIPYVLLILSLPAYTFTLNTSGVCPKLTWTLIIVSYVIFFPILYFHGIGSGGTSDTIELMNGATNGFVLNVLLGSMPGVWINSAIIYYKKKKEGFY